MGEESEESECAMCGGKVAQMMEPPSSLLILPSHPHPHPHPYEYEYPSGRKAGLPLRLCAACHPAATASSFVATSPPPPPPLLGGAPSHHRLVTAISMACKPTTTAAAAHAPPNAKKKPKARILDICRHLVGLSHSK